VTVVASDHGEGLGEHDEQTHSILIYDSTIRVPLVLRGPGVAAGTRVAEVVGLVDIAPTVLDLVGLQIPSAMQGRSLVSVVTGDVANASPPASRDYYFESYVPRLHYGWAELVGLRRGPWKLISGVRRELYNLRTDPAELTNLNTPETIRADRMHARLSPLVSGPDDDDENLELDHETREELAALGYVWVDSAATAPQPDTAARPDPVLKVTTLKQMDVARGRFLAGDKAAGIAMFAELRSEDPTNTLIIRELGKMLSIVGRHSEALGAFDAGIALAPNNPYLHTARGVALHLLGRRVEAIAAYDAALVVEPKMHKPRAYRWQLLRKMGESHRVANETRAALAADSDDVEAHLQLAFSLGTIEGPAALIGKLEQAATALPDEVPIKVALGNAWSRTGREEEAKGLYAEVLQSEPTHQVAAASLGRLLLSTGEVGSARAVLEPAAAGQVVEAEVLEALAEAMSRSGDQSAALELAKRAAAIRPDRAEAWATLGQIQMALGQGADAVASLEKAAQRAPKDPRFASLLSRFREMAAAGPKH